MRSELRGYLPGVLQPSSHGGAQKAGPKPVRWCFLASSFLCGESPVLVGFKENPTRKTHSSLVFSFEGNCCWLVLKGQQRTIHLCFLGVGGGSLCRRYPLPHLFFFLLLFMGCLNSEVISNAFNQCRTDSIDLSPDVALHEFRTRDPPKSFEHFTLTCNARC